MEPAAAAAAAAAIDLVNSNARINALEHRIAMIEIREKVDSIKLDGIITAANRWKGGFVVIVALGVLVGWLVSIGQGIGKFIK